MSGGIAEALDEFAKRVGTSLPILKDSSSSLGLRCDICNRTFTDSLAYTDHMHSKAHLAATGQGKGVQHATLSEVRERLHALAKAKEKKEKRKRGVGETVEETTASKGVEDKIGGGSAVVPKTLTGIQKEMQETLGFTSFGKK